MLISQNFLQGLKLNLLLQHLIGNYPLTLKLATQGSLKTIAHSPTKIRLQLLKIAVSLAFVAVLWLQLFQGRKKEKLVLLLESSLCVVGISVSIIMHTTYLMRNELVVQLFKSSWIRKKNVPQHQYAW